MENAQNAALVSFMRQLFVKNVNQDFLYVIAVKVFGSHINVLVAELCSPIGQLYRIKNSNFFLLFIF
ncbi:MAG: hypothetical protein ACFFCM_06150 [Promethearchaeota archaeon]